MTTPLLVCAAAAAAGCASGEPGPGWTEDDAPELVVEAPAALMPRNSMRTEAITAAALDRNAALITLLRERPLNSRLLTDHRASGGALDENAKALLQYTVSCALDRGRVVSDLNSPDGIVSSWQGELGLCGAASPWNWHERTPGKDCLELVSACVLARANAHGKQVLLSTLSAEEAPLRLPLTQVRVETAYRDPELDPAISSFSPEIPDPPGDGGPTRNYAWSERYVGVCSPRQPVRLKPSEPGLMVRVCKGIHGCDHDPAPPPPSRWYSGWIADGFLPHMASSLEFTCPAGGVPGPSSFAVMVASLDPKKAPPASADVILDDVARRRGASYPATEREVFTFREGAFYGNLFAQRIATGGTAALPNNQYACYSDLWTEPVAHLADRLCAGRGAGCFANLPGACRSSPLPSPVPDKRCAGEHEDRTYRACSGGGTAWKHVITVFLNHPCDLASDLPHCQGTYGASVP
ncbi:hypothetical protein [Sorangium sp. So ce1153]|uniref:hypothetical protein n=1 Tax=Sorangium sp. So ce1153 TaxID=3133333 RepID=UPI003F640A42